MSDLFALNGFTYSAFFKLEGKKSARRAREVLYGPGIVLETEDFKRTGRQNFCILYAYKPSGSKLAAVMRERGSHRGGVYVDFHEKDGDVDIVKRPEGVPHEAAVDMYLENLLGLIKDGRPDPIPEVVSPLVRIQCVDAVAASASKQVSKNL